jgi:hypothetical protein
MENRVPGNSSATAASPQPPNATPHREGRSLWVLTAYGISSLVLFGVLAYYFSQYIAN